MSYINNANGVRKEAFYTPGTILFDNGPKHTFSAMVDATGVKADEDGKKIIKAGTPVAGDITSRGTAFKVTKTSTAVAVMFHDADVTNGAANATLMDMGNVDMNKLDDTVAAMITEEVKTALSNVSFFK